MNRKGSSYSKPGYGKRIAHARKGKPSGSTVENIRGEHPGNIDPSSGAKRPTSPRNRK